MAADHERGGDAGPREPEFEPRAVPPLAPQLRQCRVDLDDPMWPAAVEYLDLTPTQASVVAMMLQNAGVEEVAVMLTMTRHAVRSHMDEIMRHLGVLDRGGLSRAVVQAMEICEKKRSEKA